MTTSITSFHTSPSTAGYTSSMASRPGRLIWVHPTPTITTCSHTVAQTFDDDDDDDDGLLPKTSGRDSSCYDDDDWVYVSGNIGRISITETTPEAPLSISCSGECSPADWKNKASQVINTRIQRYSEAEIHFNLLCVCDSRKAILAQQIKELVASDDPNPAQLQVRIPHSLIV